MKTKWTGASVALVAAFLFSALSARIGQAQDTTYKHYDPCLAAGIKDSVVFLGRIDEAEKATYIATAFLVDVDSVFYLVTAKHALMDEKGTVADGGLHVFFNNKQGTRVHRSVTEVKKTFSVDWRFHDDTVVDLAVIPLALDEANDAVRVIPQTLFERSDRLSELQDVFFFSYQPGLDTPAKVTPIARRGMISLFRDDRTFYIDAFIFPGNSGSPVFVKPAAMTFSSGGGIVTGDQQGCKFIGVAGEYLPYIDLAVTLQTKRPRVSFEENAGLARVWPVEFLSEIIASRGFQEQHQRVLSAARSKK